MVARTPPAVLQGNYSPCGAGLPQHGIGDEIREVALAAAYHSAVTLQIHPGLGHHLSLQSRDGHGVDLEGLEGKALVGDLSGDQNRAAFVPDQLPRLVPLHLELAHHLGPLPSLHDQHVLTLGILDHRGVRASWLKLLEIREAAQKGMGVPPTMTCAPTIFLANS